MSSGIGVGLSPVQLLNESKRKVADRRMRIAEVVLRCLICGLGALAAALVGFDREDKIFFSIDKRAKFTDVKALVFLVIANAIAASYSFLQGLRCIVSMIRGNLLFNKALAWIIFSCDQVMAYLMLAALASALQSAMFSQFGQPELQWMKVCDMYRKFCTQIGEGILSSLVASLSMVTLSSISAFNLFRLYGSDKGKGTIKW